MKRTPTPLPLRCDSKLPPRSRNAPLQLLHDPECPTETWWHLAADYPGHAPNTPLGLLLLLESPERWTHLLAHWKVQERIVTYYQSRLTPEQLKTFYAESLAAFKEVHTPNKLAGYGLHHTKVTFLLPWQILHLQQLLGPP